VAHVIGYDDVNTQRLLAMAGRGRFRPACITAGWPRRMPANARREPVTAALRQMGTT
jgi:hypothetical protein